MSANAIEAAGEMHERAVVDSGSERSAGISNEPQPLPIAFTVSKATRWVFAFVVTMVVTGIAANLVSNYVAPSPEHKLAKLMNRFDLTTEMSIPNWYSSIALLVAAVLLGVIARSTYVRRERFFSSLAGAQPDLRFFVDRRSMPDARGRQHGRFLVRAWTWVVV